MVMRHGCARGTGEKLTEFLIAQMRGRDVVERPHCTDAWEKRNHLLICVGEHSEFTSNGPKVKQQSLRITYQTHISAWDPPIWVFKQQTTLLKMGYQMGP